MSEKAIVQMLVPVDLSVSWFEKWCCDRVISYLRLTVCRTKVAVTISIMYNEVFTNKCALARFPNARADNEDKILCFSRSSPRYFVNVKNKNEPPPCKIFETINERIVKLYYTHYLLCTKWLFKSIFSIKSLIENFHHL